MCRLRRQQRGPRFSTQGSRCSSPVAPSASQEVRRPHFLPSCTARRQRPPSPAHRPNGAAGFPRRSRRTRRAHFLLKPTQAVPPSKATTRALRLHARLRAAPLRPAAFRQSGSTPTLLPSSTQRHAPTETCSRLILRADTNRRRRELSLLQLHFPRRTHDVSTPAQVVPTRTPRQLGGTPAYLQKNTHLRSSTQVSPSD